MQNITLKTNRMALIEFIRNFFSPIRTNPLEGGSLSLGVLETDVFIDLYNLTEEAQQRAKRGLPLLNQKELDEFESKIFDDFQNAVEIRISDTASYINNPRASTLTYESCLKDVGLQLEKFKDATKDLIEKAEEGISNFRAEKDEATKNYQEFKGEHQLEREAQVPESYILIWGQLSIVALIETGLNGTFFSQGSSLGLLGGVAEAIIISLINVSMGVFAGTELIRYFNYFRSNSIKLLLGLGGAVLSLAILCFNLWVGHFRSLASQCEIDQCITDARGGALQDFFNSPFDLNGDPLSILLVVIGLFIFGFSIRTGYSLDDPHPGYGDKFRDMQKPSKEIEKIITSTEQAILEWEDSVTSGIDRNYKRFKATNQLTQATHSSKKERLVSLEAWCKEAEVCLNELIVKYREINKENRTGGSPDYFNDTADLNIEFPVMDETGIEDFSEEEFKSKLEEVEKQTEDAQKEVEQTRLAGVERLTEGNE